MERINEGKQPTHFIEVWKGRASKALDQTPIMPIEELKEMLEGTKKSIMLETVAVFKFYPHEQTNN